MPCPFHPSRLRNVAKKYHKEMADKIKVAFDNEIKMQELEADLREKGYSKAADTIDRFKFSLWNYRSFPAGHWRRIRTTNTMLQLSLSNGTQTCSSGSSQWYQQGFLESFKSKAACMLKARWSKRLCLNLLSWSTLDCLIAPCATTALLALDE